MGGSVARWFALVPCGVQGVYQKPLQRDQPRQPSGS